MKYYGYKCKRCGREEERYEISQRPCGLCGGEVYRTYKGIGILSETSRVSRLRGYHPGLGEAAAGRYGLLEDQRRYVEDRLSEQYETDISVQRWETTKDQQEARWKHLGVDPVAAEEARRLKADREAKEK